MLAFWTTLVGVVFGAVCVLLIVAVLLQKGRGGGLGAAFGGMGSSAFGTRTGDVFTWITIVLTILFLLLAIASTLLFRPPTGTVAAPALDPPAGPLDGPTPVLIRCRTLGAYIAYTTDGTEPDKEGATHGRTATATIGPGKTLKARAYRENWNPSTLVTAVYTNKAPASQPGEPETQPAAEEPASPVPASQPQ